MSANNSFMVFSGTKSKYLAEKICSSLGCPLGKLVITHFADGEFSVSYEESIRGRHVSKLRQFNGTPADDRCGQTCFG